MKGKHLAPDLQSGMDWVTSCLTLLAQSENVHLEKCGWETNASAPDGRSHYLIVIGRGNKKMLKEFSDWELVNCSSDSNFQDELRTRLSKILVFLRAAPGKSRCR
jgi:hypothetical protein